jgi:hypothetical protein
MTSLRAMARDIVRADRSHQDNPATEIPIADTEKPAANVRMQFLTQGGATVNVTGSDVYGSEDNRWTCLGCDDGSDRFSSGRYLHSARDAANTHATNCRSLPKPA